MNIIVQRDRVTYTTEGDKNIYIYSLTGDLLTSHKRPALPESIYSSSVYVCDGDDDGNVLIAGMHADQLYVMNERGEYSSPRLMPVVREPRCAVMFNGSLFVTTHTGLIHKYCFYC